MISPIRLVLFVGWFYLCFYCAHRIQFSPLISTQHRGLFILASLAGGPFVFAGLVLTRAVRRSVRTGTGFGESLSQSISDLLSGLANLKNLSGRHKTQIVLMDASGRNIREIYGHGENKQKRSILELTESVINASIEKRASDILIDPRSESVFTIRFRIDGTLTTYKELEAKTARTVVSSLKAICHAQ